MNTYKPVRRRFLNVRLWARRSPCFFLSMSAMRRSVAARSQPRKWKNGQFLRNVKFLTRASSVLRFHAQDTARVQGILSLVGSLEEYRRGVLACSRCFSEGGNAPVMDLPKRSKVLLVAQAPGSTEIVTRLPFTGPAGKTLERWFGRAGVSREEVYLSALARCFPGKGRRS